MARFSDRGRMVPEFAEPEFRKLLVRSYRLVYTVHILAFIHGAQDLEHWRGRERG